MDYLRTVISGKKKKRFVSSSYNLDLSYICPRIIAMSYPAEGIESSFRNRLEDVL
jgi:phosphatidylinositol-3,4,5-trisphosphate 3-phosphatase and dual-specificity protein phosphatase PTEN